MTGKVIKRGPYTSRAFPFMRWMGRGAALTALVFIHLLAISCRDEGNEPAAAAWEIDRTFTRGPVDFRVAVSRKDITIADHVDLMIETRARDGYVVELPRFGDKLDQFGIVDYTSPPSRLGEGGVVVTERVYELEPFLSGTYRIPPMTVTFREEGDTIRHELESDTLTVEVRSILPEDIAELEIKDISPPVSMPAGRAWIYILSGALVLAAAGAALFLRLRRRAAKEDRIIPAHELAYMKLESLLGEGLIDAGRYGEFTARVSDILRHYIEDRFGLRAPERTTEEFIAEAGEGLPVGDEKKRILAVFLAHCDQVKFAAFEPSSEDVKKTFETCRDFIDATKREEVSAEAA